MNKKMIIALTVCVTAGTSNAQSAADVKKQLDAALVALSKKDLHTTDKTILLAQAALARYQAVEVTKLLPLEINGLKASADKDFIQVGNNIMAGGNTIQRNYSSGDALKNITITVKPNSPELSSVSMYLSSPQYLKTEGDITEKLVMVAGRKAIVKTNTALKKAQVAIVSGSTLYTLDAEAENYKVEELVAMASKIEIGKIETILK